jgi:hypothetical protein
LAWPLKKGFRELCKVWSGARTLDQSFKEDLMSETATAPMDPAAAQAVLVQDVYVPALVEKCAELGIQLPDEESLTAALETISMLKSAEAAKDRGLVKAAHSAIRAATGAQTPEQEAVTAEQEKKAADVAGQDRIRQALAAVRGS